MHKATILPSLLLLLLGNPPPCAGQSQRGPQTRLLGAGADRSIRYEAFSVNLPPSNSLRFELLRRAQAGDPDARVQYTHWMNLSLLDSGIQARLAGERIRFLKEDALTEANRQEAVDQLGYFNRAGGVRGLLLGIARDKAEAPPVRRAALVGLGRYLGPDEFSPVRYTANKAEKAVLLAFLGSPHAEDRLAAVVCVSYGRVTDLKARLRKELRSERDAEVRWAMRMALEKP